MSKISENKKQKFEEKRKNFPSFPVSSINTKPFGDTFHAKHSFMGGYFDRKLVDLACLFCVYTGTSKTTFLNELLTEKSKEFPTEKQMMEGICKEQLDNWIGYLESQEFEEDVQYEYRKKILWKEYKDGLYKMLRKIVPKYYANYVISYIQDAQF